MSDLMQPPSVSISLPSQTWAGILQVLKNSRGYTHQELDPLVKGLEQGLAMAQRPRPQQSALSPHLPPYDPAQHQRENST